MKSLPVDFINVEKKKVRNPVYRIFLSSLLWAFEDPLQPGSFYLIPSLNPSFSLEITEKVKEVNWKVGLKEFSTLEIVVEDSDNNLDPLIAGGFFSFSFDTMCLTKDYYVSVYKTMDEQVINEFLPSVYGQVISVKPDLFQRKQEGNLKISALFLYRDYYETKLTMKTVSTNTFDLLNEVLLEAFKDNPVIKDHPERLPWLYRLENPDGFTKDVLPSDINELTLKEVLNQIVELVDYDYYFDGSLLRIYQRLTDTFALSTDYVEKNELNFSDTKPRYKYTVHGMVGRGGAGRVVGALLAQYETSVKGWLAVWVPLVISGPGIPDSYELVDVEKNNISNKNGYPMIFEADEEKARVGMYSMEDTKWFSDLWTTYRTGYIKFKIKGDYWSQPNKIATGTYSDPRTPDGIVADEDPYINIFIKNDADALQLAQWKVRDSKRENVEINSNLLDFLEVEPGDELKTDFTDLSKEAKGEIKEITRTFRRNEEDSCELVSNLVSLKTYQIIPVKVTNIYGDSNTKEFHYFE